jgi:hypothetical protein
MQQQHQHRVSWLGHMMQQHPQRQLLLLLQLLQFLLLRLLLLQLLWWLQLRLLHQHQLISQRQLWQSKCQWLAAVYRKQQAELQSN